MASGLMTIYAPGTFASLRRRFGVTDRNYLKSLTFPYVGFSSNSKGAARSGGAFLLSRDGGYLVKNIKVSTGVFACVWDNWRDVRAIITPL